MRVLLDTNVVLDVLLQRGEWLAGAQAIWQASIDGGLESCITASSLTDIYYISRRLVGAQAARHTVRTCLDSLSIMTVDKETLEQAYALPVNDFEDALQMAAAVRNGLTALVSRDPSGFSGSPVPVLSPAELVARLQATG
jgi:predicted nucleic acid-binding protein